MSGIAENLKEEPESEYFKVNSEYLLLKKKKSFSQFQCCSFAEEAH